MPTDGNRSIFVAKNQSAEIVGCCEVIEERLDLSYLYTEAETNTSKQSRKKNGRLRPIIENLCVHQEYRRKRIGKDLIKACEKAVQAWIPMHDEVYAQVEEGNTSAINFFSECGYTMLFVDPLSKKVTLDGTLFPKESIVSKWMLRKILNNDVDSQFF